MTANVKNLLKDQRMYLYKKSGQFQIFFVNYLLKDQRKTLEKNPEFQIIYVKSLLTKANL